MAATPPHPLQRTPFWQTAVLALACLLPLPAAAPEGAPLDPKAEEKPLTGPGGGVEASVTVKGSRFSYGQISGPAFQLSIAIRNPGAEPLELSGPLVVLEKEQGSEACASTYVSRERSKPAAAGKAASSGSFLEGLDGKPSDVRRRYHLTWGQDIDAEGKSMLLFIGGGMFTVTMASPGAYEGLGWGRVSPRVERTLAVELPFPYMIKGKREYLAVVLPWIRPLGKPGEPAVATICKFEPAEASAGAGFKLLETIRVPLKTPDLKAIASNTNVEVWRRVFALNWLAESAPRDAIEPLLAAVAAGGAPEMLRKAAAYNLGAMKEKSAVGPLLTVLAAAQDDTQRIWPIEALGQIGAVEAAPALRPYFSSKDDGLAKVAIEASGKLKDPEAVAPLLAILGGKDQKNRRGDAASALAAIATPAAADGLTGVLRTGPDDAREIAARTLGDSGSAPAVAALAAVSADAKAKESLRSEALRALGRIGGPEALAALKAGAESGKEQLRRAALSALAALPDNAGTPPLIDYAGKPGYQSRDQAVQELVRTRKIEALPVLRKLVADKTAPAPARLAAAGGLRQMQDRDGAEALRAALDDSNKELYEQALGDLAAIAGPAAGEAAVAALKSVHSGVRRAAAGQIARAKLASAAGPLWEAYKTEKDEWAGNEMAQALTAAGFQDEAAVSFLISRLDPRANKLWYSDVELLRRLTGQTFGPPNKYTDNKQRDAELRKWRDWGATRK